MRRQLLSFVAVIAIVAAVPAMAADLETHSQIDAVTVYPDGASVTRLIKLDLPSGDSTLIAKDFPLSLDPSSLRVEGEGSARLVIGGVDTRQPGPVPKANLPEIDRKIEALRDERAALDGEIASAAARRKFAERFAESSPAGLGEKGEARPLSEWRAAFAAVAEEVADADKAIREARVKQRDIDRDIAKIEAERHATPPRKLEVRIGLNADRSAPATLRVTYTVRSARWAPIYDARLDTGGKDRKPSLELVRRAEIFQNTGEDWSDTALAVSTVRTAAGGNAPELRPLIVRYPVPVQVGLGRAAGNMPMAASPARKILDKDELAAVESDVKARRAEEQEAALDAGSFQVVFKIPGRVSIPAGQGSKSVRIASANVAPELAVHAVPALNENAFLQASFKHAEDAPLLPGRTAIYCDDVFVGRGAISLSAKDETVRLGFGVDEKVKVTRVTVRKTEGTAGILIGTSKTEEREFKTTVRNGHEFAMPVKIEDQIPVSENEDIQVEMLPVTTPPTARDLRDRRGVLEWAFDAKPGETREIKLGWRVRWPKEKAVQFIPQGS
jgi:uncharacterized protein (TIGR02231 family)